VVAAVRPIGYLTHFFTGRKRFANGVASVYIGLTKNLRELLAVEHTVDGFILFNFFSKFKNPRNLFEIPK
jgi:hypothetical protein